MNGKREFGDFQTPADFANNICLYLKNVRGLTPAAVVEPTCGKGSFLKSALIFDAEEYYGIEINEEYCEYSRAALTDKRVSIINADFFAFDLKRLSSKEPVLLIGNPPWVNNSYLSSLSSTNLPQKANIKGLKGIDAITGASNFDICEFIILKLIETYKNTNAAIAMLCKTAVARNIFIEMKRRHISFSCCDIVEFDASKVFDVSASACLLFIQLSSEAVSASVCNVTSIDSPEKVNKTLGYVNSQLYSDVSSMAYDFDGHCCFEWRQGVKHDCSSVMELSKRNGDLFNANNERVDIEQDIVYPLVKSSMFKTPIISDFTKYVIVTQKRVREDTCYIKAKLPKTWRYLEENIELFRRRKSSIYTGAPEFSMFGVGDYSYARYKVGVSGFYKEPLFSVMYMSSGKPVMTDDTCYYIGFPTYNDAYVAMLYLNCARTQSFLKSISFSDAKRPFTKAVLERIDFSKLVQDISFIELRETENKFRLEAYITEQMMRQFSQVREMQQLRLA